jgi:hypothetical protein
LHTSIIGKAPTAAARPQLRSRDQLELDALIKYVTGWVLALAAAVLARATSPGALVDYSTSASGSGISEYGAAATTLDGHSKTDRLLPVPDPLILRTHAAPGWMGLVGTHRTPWRGVRGARPPGSP